jgi:asparagine synthase (glutamine-hydrolysing)
MANEDQSVVVRLNGEICNFQSQRAELEAAVHHFHSRSDTEVLVNGYEQWGQKLVDRLYGMFAFAIWYAKKKASLPRPQSHGD